MITVLEREKKQRILVLIFFGMILILFLILYFGYFKRGEIPSLIPDSKISPNLPVERKKIEIDFEVLKSPILKRVQVQTFDRIEEPKFEEIERGRENPFKPY